MGGTAWVTLATNDSYALGALVLAHSLRKVGTNHPMAILVTSGVTEPMKIKLATIFSIVREVNLLDSQDKNNLMLLNRPELGITFTKLHCWRLTEFDKCVFLDADTLVLKNCDELFEREELSAAPDVGWPDCFNSGVFVYRPSEQTFKNLVQFALEHGSFDGGDQGLLNMYFSGWAHTDISKHLPYIYNMGSVAIYSYLPAFKQYGEGVKIVHFLGTAKPWLHYFDTETCTVRPCSGFEHLKTVLQMWWDIFSAHVHPELSSDMIHSGTGIIHYLTKSFSKVIPSYETYANGDNPDYPQYFPWHDESIIYKPDNWDPWENYTEKLSPGENKYNTDKKRENFNQVQTHDQYSESNNRTFQQSNIKQFENSDHSESYSISHHEHHTSHNLVETFHPQEHLHSNSIQQSHQTEIQQPTHQTYNTSHDRVEHHQETFYPPEHLKHHIHPDTSQSNHSEHSYSEQQFHKNETQQPTHKTQHNYHSSIQHLDQISTHIPDPSHKPYKETFEEVHFYKNTPSAKDKIIVETETFNSDVPINPGRVEEFDKSTAFSALPAHDNANDSNNSAGIAAVFSRFTLGVRRSEEQSVIEDHFRRQNWEVGNIDFLGLDSFSNIWKKICQTISTEPSAPEESEKEQVPTLEGMIESVKIADD